MPNNPEALICAHVLGGRSLESLTAANHWQAAEGPLWLHLNRHADDSRRWLTKSREVSAADRDALLAEETRPRLLINERRLLLILRGVNLNPGADPEDMVSIRVWINAERIISLRGPQLLAVLDIRKSLDNGGGPRSTGQWLAQLTEGLTERMAPVLDDIADALDGVEDELLTRTGPDLRSTLASRRRQAIALRRFLAPQREVLQRLYANPPDWLDDLDKGRIRESADRLNRFVEDLDALRERAMVTQEELNTRAAERMNRNMYLLALVTAVFLPLGFVTGLLGMNVAGLPGTEYPRAFWLVAGGMLSLVVLQIAVLSRRRWWGA